MIGAGLGAWTDVLAESRGDHWRIRQDRLNDLGEKYAALVVHYFPETGGEMSLWGAALMGTGTVFGPPLAKDVATAMRTARSQFTGQAARQPQPPPPFWYQPGTPEPPPQPPPWETPPPSWGSPAAEPFPAPPGFIPPQPAPSWEPPSPIVDEQGNPVPESQESVDLRSIGQAMGLSDDQISFALNMVQGMMGGEPS